MLRIRLRGEKSKAAGYLLWARKQLRKFLRSNIHRPVAEKNIYLGDGTEIALKKCYAINTIRIYATSEISGGMYVFLVSILGGPNRVLALRLTVNEDLNQYAVRAVSSDFLSESIDYLPGTISWKSGQDNQSLNVKSHPNCRQHFAALPFIQFFTYTSVDSHRNRAEPLVNRFGTLMRNQWSWRTWRGYPLNYLPSFSSTEIEMETFRDQNLEPYTPRSYEAGSDYQWSVLLQQWIGKLLPYERWADGRRPYELNPEDGLLIAKNISIHQEEGNFAILESGAPVYQLFVQWKEINPNILPDEPPELWWVRGSDLPMQNGSEHYLALGGFSPSCTDPLISEDGSGNPWEAFNVTTTYSCEWVQADNAPVISDNRLNYLAVLSKDKFIYTEQRYSEFQTTTGPRGEASKTFNSQGGVWDIWWGWWTRIATYEVINYELAPTITTTATLETRLYVGRWLIDTFTRTQYSSSRPSDGWEIIDYFKRQTTQRQVGEPDRWSITTREGDWVQDPQTEEWSLRVPPAVSTLYGNTLREVMDYDNKDVDDYFIAGYDYDIRETFAGDYRWENRWGVAYVCGDGALVKFELPYFYITVTPAGQAVSQVQAGSKRVVGLSTQINKDCMVYTYIVEAYNFETSAFEYDTRIVGVINIGHSGLPVGHRQEFEITDELLGDITYDSSWIAAIGYHIKGKET